MVGAAAATHLHGDLQRARRRADRRHGRRRHERQRRDAGRRRGLPHTAARAGRATALRLRLAPNSTASRAGARPLRRHRRPADRRCSASGRINRPQAGQWAEVPIANGPSSWPGRRTGSACSTRPTAPAPCAGTTAPGAPAGPSRRARADTLTTLPGDVGTGGTWTDGPLSGYVMGAPRPAAAAGARRDAHVAVVLAPPRAAPTRRRKTLARRQHRRRDALLHRDRRRGLADRDPGERHRAARRSAWR